ncbi:MAG: hypothetical protein LBM77_08020 [Spirochaetaceae bacterium]|jgi:hypothetical protein|nr:hypothetical protein [Spirochaetaceae bacterium]
MQMQEKTETIEIDAHDLPHFSKVPFWDCEIKVPDLVRMQDFVIERILVYGNEEDIRQLFAFYGTKIIKKAAIKSVNLNRRTACYLNAILGIPLRKFKCFKPAQLTKTY